MRIIPHIYAPLARTHVTAEGKVLAMLIEIKPELSLLSALLQLLPH